MVIFLLPHCPQSTAAPAEARTMTDDAAFASLQRHQAVLAVAEAYFWQSAMSADKLGVLNRYALQQLLTLCFQRVATAGADVQVRAPRLGHAM